MRLIRNTTAISSLYWYQSSRIAPKAFVAGKPTLDSVSVVIANFQGVKAAPTESPNVLCDKTQRFSKRSSAHSMDVKNNSSNNKLAERSMTAILIAT